MPLWDLIGQCNAAGFEQNYSSASIHHVKVQSLLPNTRYFYTVGDGSDANSSPVLNFTTAPLPGTYPFRQGPSQFKFLHYLKHPLQLTLAHTLCRSLHISCRTSNMEGSDQRNEQLFQVLHRPDLLCSSHWLNHFLARACTKVQGPDHLVSSGIMIQGRPVSICTISSLVLTAAAAHSLYVSASVTYRDEFFTCLEKGTVGATCPVIQT